MKRLFKCRDHILDMSAKTYIMGILNVTPDSFSDGGDYIDAGAAVEHAGQMLADGADIIDIGAQSTRPGSTVISADEERNRLETVLPRIARDFPDAVLSVDTFYPDIAVIAAQAGVHIINDVSGGSRDMFDVAAKYGMGMVIMHPGDPNDISGEEDIIKKAEDFFALKKTMALMAGLSEEQLCFDPGIGFGKSHEQNLELVRATAKLSRFGSAYLIGLSRKRVTDTGNIPPKKRLGSTISLNTAAQLLGANILRVHDVFDSAAAARAIDALMQKHS